MQHFLHKHLELKSGELTNWSVRSDRDKFSYQLAYNNSELINRIGFEVIGNIGV